MKEVIEFTAIIVAIILTCTHVLPPIARYVDGKEGNPSTAKAILFAAAVWGLAYWLVGWANS